MTYPNPNPNLHSFATDGIFLYFSPERIIQLFQSNPKFLNRAMLHSVLHCVFSHLWLSNQRDPSLWNLSCDIAVEYTIDQLEKPSTKRILSLNRKQCYENLQNQDCGISAATIYHFLKECSQEELQNLEFEFFTDDHRFWPYEQKNKSMLPPQVQKWNQISRQISLQQKQNGSYAEKGQQLFEIQSKIQRSQRNYRDFLQKFTLLREELQIDPDEFDLNYYTFHMLLSQYFFLV